MLCIKSYIVCNKCIVNLALYWTNRNKVNTYNIRTLFIFKLKIKVLFALEGESRIHQYFFL